MKALVASLAALALLAAGPPDPDAAKQTFRREIQRVLDARAGSFMALQSGLGSGTRTGRRWAASVALAPFDPATGCEVVLTGSSARYECRASAKGRDAWDTYAWLEEQVRDAVPLEWAKNRHREGRAMLYRVSDGAHPVVVLSIQTEDDVDFEVDLLVYR